MSHAEATGIIRKAGRGNVEEGVDELVAEANRDPIGGDVHLAVFCGPLVWLSSHFDSPGLEKCHGSHR